MPAEVDLTLPLPGLSPVCGKPVVARFDGGRLSSDAGVLLLAEIERRHGIADRLARCLEDPRAPDRIVHGLAEMIRFRALAIAAGYVSGRGTPRVTGRLGLPRASCWRSRVPRGSGQWCRGPGPAKRAAPCR